MGLMGGFSCTDSGCCCTCNLPCGFFGVDGLLGLVREVLVVGKELFAGEFLVTMAAKGSTVSCGSSARGGGRSDNHSRWVGRVEADATREWVISGAETFSPPLD
jgi:hypothetical protein